jgi:HPt (histidine-containing phosphotransfer) domain-containing protein
MRKHEEAKISILLSDLWERNLPTLRERLDILDRAASTASSGKLPEDARAEALDIAHRLSGSLGMFGYHQGTEIARQIEEILKAPTPASLVRLTPLTRDLRQSLAEKK